MNEIVPPQSETISQWVIASLMTVPAAIFGLQKLMRSWSADRKGRVADDAQTDVYAGLVLEIARLRKQNMELATDLNSAQELASRLASELRRMSGEVSELQIRLSELIAKNNGA